MSKDLNRSIKIFIDNSDALKSSKQLENEIASLRAELQKLAAEGSNETKLYKDKSNALERATKQQEAYAKKIAETERVLKNLSGATYNELYSVRRTMQSELKKATRGTEEYNQKLVAYQALQKQITIAQREMNGTLGTQATVWSKVANSFNKYFGIVTTAVASITGVSMAFRKLSQDAAQMEDTYADVMKTTGMTREEVGGLNEEFKKMDTRTAREQLNMLARDAGKLGLTSRKDILDFVEAGNQINVALGEDLGEGAIKEIGKMTEIFKLSTKELNQMDLKNRMLSIGSAINELGQSSTASEPYLVSFTQRLGGVASQAGISVQNILGYASALDQSGQAVEMSATALQKFIMKVMGDSAKFAELAGIEINKFNQMLKTDTNEAIKTVLRSLSEKGGFQELIPIFQEMGLDGARAVGVLSALATNIDKVDEAQRIANESFAEAVSLTDEYNVKNENAQAQLEKRRKAFKDAAEELGNRLNPALLKSTNYVTYLIKILPGFLDFLGKYGKYILYLASAYAIYIVGVKASILWNTRLKTALSLSNIQLKLQNTWLIITRVAMLAYNVVLGLVTGNFTMMRRAWILLSASMASNPIGLIAVAAAAAITGIIKLVQWLNRTSEATKTLKEASKQYSSELATETRQANQLFDAFKRTNKETDIHLQLKKQIISRYGKYLQGLIDEHGNITNIGEAINAVNKGIREQIALKIRNQATDKLTTDFIDKQIDLTDKLMKRVAKQVPSTMIQSAIRETINKTVSEFQAAGGKDYAQLQQKMLSDLQSVYGVDAYKGMRNIKNVVSDLVDEVKKSDQAIASVKEQFNGMISEQLDLTDILKDDDPDVVTPFTPGDADKDIYKKKLAELNFYIEGRRQQIMRDHLSGKITAEQYNHQLEQLEKESLDRKLEIYNLDPEKRQEVWNLILQNQIKAQQVLEESERKHQRKLQEIREKADEARKEQNWKTLKAIADQNVRDWENRREEEAKKTADLIDLGMSFADEMGVMVGNALTGNEDMVKSSLKTIISMALDALKVQVQIAAAGATAQSLAQPDSILTFGASGLARAAIIVGLIEAAFSAVKAVVNNAIGGVGGGSSSGGSSSTTQRVVQRRYGKYDVVGADDGRTYRNVPYLGDAATGIVSRPTLMGEYGRELIVSSPDFNRLQRHVNYPLVVQAINQSRVPQRASGNYESIPRTPSTPTQPDNSYIQEMIELLQYLKRHGVEATVNYHSFERAKNNIDGIRNRAKR